MSDLVNEAMELPDESDLSKRLRVEKKRVKELEAVVESQQQQLEKARTTKWKQKSRKTPKLKGEFTRVIIPDTHGCLVDKAAVAAFLGDLEQLNPREVVWLGDHLDCGGFLAQHFTVGFVAETSYTFEEDVAQANNLLDAVQQRTKKATHYYLEGNHEERIEKFCVTTALRSKVDSDYFFRMWGPPQVLNLKKRGINYFKRSEHHMGLRHVGAIKLGHCIFTHGHRTGVTATRRMLDDYASNVVFGHIHNISSYSKVVMDGEIAAWCPGCLCGQQPKYYRSTPTNWSHGYGVQVVRPNGDFLHISVPIIDGNSYLMNLIK